MLHIFDAESELLVLLSVLIFSIQCQSYVTNTNFRWQSILPGMAMAAVARFIWQHIVYGSEELWQLGIFT